MDRYKQAEVGSLEASLLKLINAHNQSSIQLPEHTETAKKDTIENAKWVAALLVDCVDGGVQEAFLMEKRIEMEIRSLAAAILWFGRDTDQWLAASHSINTAIKEIGDFENWMKTMELDCRSINAAICKIHES